VKVGDHFGVRIEASFAARHRVDEAGEPAAEHGHDWQVEVSVASTRLDAIAIVVDFRKLRADTEALWAEIGDRPIEEHPDFRDSPATPLAVAKWILRRLSALYARQPFRVASVEVGCDAGITFLAEELAARARGRR